MLEDLWKGNNRNHFQSFQGGIHLLLYVMPIFIISLLVMAMLVFLDFKDTKVYQAKTDADLAKIREQTSRLYEKRHTFREQNINGER